MDKIMTEIELTIGIPTYNGDRYLAETIDSVLLQLPDIQGRRIEIIISDNASTDNTSTIVKRYVAAYPEIVFYTANPQNIGYDRNVDMLFKAAKGEYLWLLGDDDMLVPGALKKFFSVIQQYKNIAIFVLSVSFLYINTGKKVWNRKYQADRFCSDGDELLQQSLWGTSALSSLCFRRNDWNTENLDKYLGTQWIHIGGMIEVMSHKRKAYIFSDEMVIVRMNNPRWAGHFGNQLEVGLKHLSVFETTTKLGYDSRTFKCFLADRYANNFKDIFFLRPPGFKCKMAIAERMIHFFKDKPGFWLFHLPVLFTPNVISGALVNIARRAKRIFKILSLKAVISQ